MHGLGQIWQTASSWKGYCQLLAISAAILGNEPCLRVLHGLGGDAAASLAAANAGGMTLAHVAAGDEHEGCLRVLHELGGDRRRPAWRQQMQVAGRPPTAPLLTGTRAVYACCTSWAVRWRPAWWQ